MTMFPVWDLQFDNISDYVNAANTGVGINFQGAIYDKIDYLRLEVGTLEQEEDRVMDAQRLVEEQINSERKRLGAINQAREDHKTVVRTEWEATEALFNVRQREYTLKKDELKELARESVRADREKTKLKQSHQLDLSAFGNAEREFERITASLNTAIAECQARINTIGVIPPRVVAQPNPRLQQARRELAQWQRCLQQVQEGVNESKAVFNKIFNAVEESSDDDTTLYPNLGDAELDAMNIDEDHVEVVALIGNEVEEKKKKKKIQRRSRGSFKCSICYEEFVSVSRRLLDQHLASSHNVKQPIVKHYY